VLKVKTCVYRQRTWDIIPEIQLDALLFLNLFPRPPGLKPWEQTAKSQLAGNSVRNLKNPGNVKREDMAHGIGQ
jgi:hypothetical protein